MKPLKARMDSEVKKMGWFKLNVTKSVPINSKNTIPVVYLQYGVSITSIPTPFNAYASCRCPDPIVENLLLRLPLLLTAFAIL